MILEQYVPMLKTLEPYFVREMLVLGDQEYKTGYRFPYTVKTMDIQGHADYLHDITTTFPLQFDAVFNLGTLEHIWDVHNAYINTAKMIKVGGYYIGHHPVAGWENHGIHVTSDKFIAKFFLLNGFSAELQIVTDAQCNKNNVSRDCGKSLIYWCVFKKQLEPIEYKAPIDLCQG